MNSAAKRASTFRWTMTLQTATGRLNLIFYPKISYVWGGYRVQPDTWEHLQTFLAE